MTKLLLVEKVYYNHQSWEGLTENKQAKLKQNHASIRIFRPASPLGMP